MFRRTGYVVDGHWHRVWRKNKKLKSKNLENPYKPEKLKSYIFPAQLKSMVIANWMKYIWTLYEIKMVNGFRYYRALESVSIASALSAALTVYPCQIRVHQRWQSKLQLPTARKKEWRPATAGSSPHAVTCQHCDTHYFSRPRTRNLPIVGPTRYQ